MPCIFNCCIDARAAFTREWDESTTGTGFDKWVRDRMMAKATLGVFVRWACASFGHSTSSSWSATMADTGPFPWNTSWRIGLGVNWSVNDTATVRQGSAPPISSEAT